MSKLTLVVHALAADNHFLAYSLRSPASALIFMFRTWTPHSLYQAGAFSGFHSMNVTRSIAVHWMACDASPLQVTIHPFIHLGGKKHCMLN